MTTIRRWQAKGLGGPEGSTRGVEQSVNGHQADLQYLEQCLELEARTYNSLQRASEVMPGATGKIKS